MIPIVYHPNYNVTAFGLERLHPFDGQKYGRIHSALIARGLRRGVDFVQPRPARRADLLKVHTSGYLDSLKDSKVVAGILEVDVVRKLPAWLVDWSILRRMRSATGGTILAARCALKHGLAINLGGGYHHAMSDRASGFCPYADAALAARILHDEGKAGRVLVVDLDAHQGNGTASVFQGWPWASIFDLYQRDLFPYPKEPEDFPIPVDSGLAGAAYLTLLQRSLPDVLDSTKPDLLIYNAGSDPFQGDPLAGFGLTAADLAERDLMVVSMAVERQIPLAMVLSGGYSRESWRIHADSIEGILARFDRSIGGSTVGTG